MPKAVNRVQIYYMHQPEQKPCNPLTRRIGQKSSFESGVMIRRPSMNKPTSKLRHSLSQINTKKMTAICAVCGRTDIRKRSHRQSTIYICATKKRAYGALYRQEYFPPHPRVYRPSAHVLSEIDDEKKTAVCSRCGPVKIYVAQSRNSVSRRCSKANIIAQQKRRERDEKAFQK